MVDDEAPTGIDDNDLVTTLAHLYTSLETVKEELVAKVVEQAAEIKTLKEKVETMEAQILGLENDDPWTSITKQFADRIEEIQDILRKDGHWLQHVRRAGDSW